MSLVSKDNGNDTIHIMNARILAVQKELLARPLSALFVSNHFNIFYLCGFMGLSQTEREGYMLITQKSAYIFVDGRYSPNVKDCIVKYISPQKSLSSHLVDIIKQENLAQIGFEADDLRFNEYIKFEKIATFVPTKSIIVGIRTYKDAYEVDCMKKAAALADTALKSILSLIKPGKTEGEIAWKIEQYIKEKGHDLSFYPIVAVDKNASIPHYDTKADGSTKIKNGSVVLIDFGAKYKHYLSDMTRMVFVGSPKPEIAHVYKTLLIAQIQGLAQLVKTNDPQLIDKACRDVLEKNNLPNYAHSTGHGVGIEIHENPKISHLSKDILQKNMVFTVEPGVYVPHKYGMRIEDTVWMSADKKPVILTKFPKKMLII